MIKKIFLVLALLIITVPPASATPKKKVDAVEANDYCRAIMSIATDVMEVRQSGIPMVDSLDALDKLTDKIDSGNHDADRLIKNIALMMITRAYDLPKYESEFDKEEASIEFGNQYYIRCMKSVVE